MTLRTLFSVLLCGVLATFAFADSAEPESGDAFSLEPDSLGHVLKTPDGDTVFRYMTKKPTETNLTANSVCCLYPVYTPGGKRAVDFAPGDHRHHRGVFLAWHALTVGDKRADFWGWGSWAPTENRVIENRGVELAGADEDKAVLKVHNEWMVGEQVGIDEQTNITARQIEGVYVIDLDFHLTPRVNVTLDQTAFGGFCIKGRKGEDRMYVDSDGPVELPNPHHMKPESDWPAKPWYDYVVTLSEGSKIGVAVVDHPDNPPSPWHNLKPIAMVNPCIVAPGEVEIKKGETLRLRYRLVVHDGPTPVALLDKRSKQVGSARD